MGFFYAPRGRGFFLLGLFSIFGLENGRMFEFLSSVLCLGEDTRSLGIRSLRLREGGVRLGGLEDETSGLSSPLRRGCCSPRRTTSPRRR